MSSRLRFAFILIFIVLLCAPASAVEMLYPQKPGTVRDPLPYRIISFHRGRTNRELIKLAAGLGFNGVMFQFENGNVKRLEEWAEKDREQQIVKFCHDLGMKVTVWVHELEEIPKKGESGYVGEVSADNEALWKMLEDRYERIFSSLLPEIDGVVLTVVESKVNAANTALMNRIAQVIDSKCRKYNKEFIVRTFTWTPEELEQVTDAVKQLPQDVTIMSKCTPQDWQIRGCFDQTIGRVNNRTQIVEYDIAGEYFFLDHVANCMPDYLKKHFDYGLANGVDGICVRVDRASNDVLHNPQEMNLWTLGMLATGAIDNVEDAWTAWAEHRYGREAAPDIIKILKPTYDVVAEILNIGPFSFGDTRYNPPTVQQRILTNTFQAWKWDKTYVPIFELADQGNPNFTRKIEQQKRRAIELAKQSLADLEVNKNKLTPEDYEILRTKLLTNLVQLEIRTPMMLSVLKYKRMAYIKDQKERELRAAEIRDLIKEMRSAFDRPFPQSRSIKHRGKDYNAGSPTRLDIPMLRAWADKMEQKTTELAEKKL